MSSRKETILIVEDNHDHMKMATTILRNMGYTVLQAANGKDGLETAKAKRPDIILMDIQMPVMDGLTATRELKSNDSTEDIPLIVLTARDDPETRTKAKQAGCNGFFAKPLTPYLVDTEFKGVLRRAERVKKAKLDEHLIRESRVHNLRCPFVKETKGKLICSRIDLRCGQRQQFSPAMEPEDHTIRKKPHPCLLQSGEKPIILVVDDDPVMRKLCGEYLERMNIPKYCEARNASESKLILDNGKRNNQPVQIVISDVLMGSEEESGHTLARFVDERNYPCPVILVSQDKKMLEFDTRHNIVKFRLARPFTFEQFKDALTPCMGENG